MTGGVVEYDVKDLLDDIKKSVDRIDSKLDLKADRERVHDLASRLHAMELERALVQQMLRDFKDCQTDVEELKSAAASSKTLDSYKRWLVGIAVAVAMLLVAVLGLLGKVAFG